MRVIITNCITIEEPTNDIKKYCKEKLTFKNPDYDKKRRMGIWLGNCPKEIKLYDYFQNTLYIPIGCFNDVWDLHPYINDYTDYSNYKYIDIKSNIVLRDYQKPCLNGIKENYTGLFILPAG